MKSKMSPRTRMKIRTNRSALGVNSGILQADIAQHRSYVFALIGCVFEQLVQIVPAHSLDELRDLGDPVVQRRDRLCEQVVGFVLEAMDLLRGAIERFGL